MIKIFYEDSMISNVEELWKAIQDNTPIVAGSHANLSFANFPNTNLANAVFRETCFSNSNLCHSNLQKADFFRSDLKSARLECANLSGANLSYCDFSWANLEGANLSNADLGYTNFSGANLKGVNLEKACLYHTVGNGREIISLQSGIYHACYTSEYLQIGDENHKHQDWLNFSEVRISRMDKRMWGWWENHHKTIFDWIKLNPATPTVE